MTSCVSAPSRYAWRTARRMIARRTYPRPSFDGTTPSAMRKVIVRPWSARIRSHRSRSPPGNPPYVVPDARGGRLDEREQQVGVPRRGDALQHGEVALEAGAGVDARLGQRQQLAVGLGVELHEHEVPDLEVAVFALGRSALGAELGPEVVEDLRRRAARAGVAHRQKLSASPMRWTRSAGRPTTSVQIRSASSSVVVHRDPDPVGIELEDLA